VYYRDRYYDDELDRSLTLRNVRLCMFLRAGKSLDWSIFGSLERIYISYIHYRDQCSDDELDRFLTLRNIQSLTFL